MHISPLPDLHLIIVASSQDIVILPLAIDLQFVAAILNNFVFIARSSPNVGLIIVTNLNL